VSPPPHSPPAPKLLDPFTLGTICGLASAVIYTAANSFLRAASDCDPVWVSAVKAVPTALFMAPWLFTLWRQGIPLFPSWKIVLMTIAAGLGGQLVGNVTFQWGLGQVGLALTASLNLGGMIVAAAILGRVFLHEPVTPRAAVSLGLLLAAIAVLSLGASDAHQSVSAIAPTNMQIALGVGAGCLSGLAYAILNVVIRYGVVRGMPLPTTLFVVSGSGMVSLGLLSWLRIGTAGMAATEPQDLGMMLMAGVCNALAFLALTKSLQLTSVVYVNALNAAQASLAALAGILIFQEALSPWLLAGVALTIAGLLLLTRTRQNVAVPET
jgi:drug/metabolite transporter (DMT)-like permease